ncbi:hypothetical protein GOV14_05660 [Candidatus Pacearchaeota archaeon]|nr:hypothetical protein [Candidatus Pacearchaeota archaeon]
MSLDTKTTYEGRKEDKDSETSLDNNSVFWHDDELKPYTFVNRWQNQVSYTPKQQKDILDFYYRHLITGKSQDIHEAAMEEHEEGHPEYLLDLALEKAFFENPQELKLTIETALEKRDRLRFNAYKNRHEA